MVGKQALVVIDVQEYFCRPLRESHEWALRVAIPTFASVVTTGEVLAGAGGATAAAMHATGE